MLLDLLFAVIGIASASAYIWVAGKLTLERWMYTPTIAILPLIYVGFALLGSSPEAAMLELLYGMPYFALALLALKIRNETFYTIAGAAWLIHGVYDVAHDAFFVNPGVWLWYPAFCAGFDIGIGSYLLYAGRRIAISMPEARV